MTKEDLRAWQKRMGYTYATASEALGVSRSTYGLWLKSGTPKNNMLKLSCDMLEWTKTVIEGIEK